MGGNEDVKWGAPKYFLALRGGAAAMKILDIPKGEEFSRAWSVHSHQHQHFHNACFGKVNFHFLFLIYS
jgi:hypothetical protein